VNDTREPVRDLGPGHRIEHDLMPGFVMEIRGVRSCQADSARPEEHAAFKVTDPRGKEDWLCAYDVHAA
jgi:hypothetical protein